MALLDSLPSAQVPHSFPLHHLLREACRARGEATLVDEISSRIDAHGLTNISPEATIHIETADGKEETVSHITGSFVPELAKAVNDLVHDAKARGGYTIQHSAIPHERAASQSVEKNEMTLRK